MEIVLVRHAQPDWEPDDRAVDNPGLTALGHAQAQRIGKHLAGEHFDAVYLSPLRRVAETAAPYLEASGQKAEVRDWRRETGLPSLEGQTTAEVEAYFSRAWAREFSEWWEGMPGGEPFRAFYQRVSEGLDTLLGDRHGAHVYEEAGQRLWEIEDPQQRALIFAHEGTNAALVCHLVGADPIPWNHLRFSTNWAGITRLHLARIGSRWVWSMKSFNALGHLQDLDERGAGSGRSGSE